MCIDYYGYLNIDYGTLHYCFLAENQNQMPKCETIFLLYKKKRNLSAEAHKPPINHQIFAVL